MSLGATAFPLIACGTDESLITEAIGSFDVRHIEDAAEEVLSTLELTVDDAARLMKDVLRLREEARQKSGFYEVRPNNPLSDVCR